MQYIKSTVRARTYEQQRLLFAAATAETEHIFHGRIMFSKSTCKREECTAYGVRSMRYDLRQYTFIRTFVRCAVCYGNCHVSPVFVCLRVSAYALIQSVQMWNRIRAFASPLSCICLSPSLSPLYFHSFVL